ncbi:unnamed protein product [Allacma fusca]|uniref:Uncharacterized protein n=1 Tax=Allacma fusca TaxID=39272 RepID=A0A8J2KUP3_9HEXA|nr:unnamed protein product [Allacma fusca]
MDQKCIGFVSARDKMIDISFEIVICTLLDSSLGKSPITFEIKTFWCKPVKVVGDVFGKTERISLSGLSVADYLAKERDGDKLTICIEVSKPGVQLSNKERLIMSEGNFHIGVVLVHLNELLRKPYLSPLWQSLPIINVIKGTKEGSIYMTLEAQIHSLHGFGLDVGVNDKDKISSYFSTSANSNPALFCPPHLIDHVSGIINRETQPSRDHCDGEMMELNSKGLAEKEPVSTREVKVQTTTETTAKVHPMVAHNVCTSPDFPFHVPAVEKVEKRLRFQQLSGMNGHNVATDLSTISSPPMFGYTPFMDKTVESKQSKKPELDKSVEDIIELLGSVTTQRGTNKPLKFKEDKQKPKIPTPDTVGKKPCKKSEMTPMKMTFGPPPPKPERVSTIIYANRNSPRIPLSPKQSSSKPKNVVPGLTIKSYKPPSTSEEAQNFYTPPQKRRIAANIFNDT